MSRIPTANRSPNEDVEAATAREREQLRDRPEIYLRANASRGAMHAFNDCQRLKTHVVTKDPAVYPPGFKDWCLRCVHRWRQAEAGGGQR